MARLTDVHVLTCALIATVFALVLMSNVAVAKKTQSRTANKNYKNGYFRSFTSPYNYECMGQVLTSGLELPRSGMTVRADNSNGRIFYGRGCDTRGQCKIICGRTIDSVEYYGRGVVKCTRWGWRNKRRCRIREKCNSDGSSCVDVY